MVGPWVNSGQRKSVGFFQRIRSHHLGKKRFVLPFSKTDLLNSMDRSSDPIISSQFSTSASTWRPQKFDGLERLWDQNSNEPQSDVNVEPLVIRNPVHSRKLEEPIERKREYWSENLLYIMRREGLIPKNRPVVMDRPTPEEPYRLSANVVRLLEQEPQLYLAKSNIKISSFDSEISDGIPSGSAGSWDQKPFPYSRAKYGAEEKAGSFEVSSNRPPHHCCECGREKSPKPLPTEGFGRKSLSFSSLSELRSRHPVHEQSRHYFSTAARKPAQPCLDDRVAYDWNPANHVALKKYHVGGDEISRAIQKLWHEKRQKQSTYEAKLKMKERLETRMFTNYEFTITGSSANGFGFDNCDVDINVECKSGDSPLAHKDVSLKILRKMRAHMIGDGDFRSPMVINAICPILQFTYMARKYRRNIRVDINASGNVGILNTQLLYSYSRMDPRLAPLVGAYKQWASAMNIKDAQKQLLSSYSLTLMVIYFLQSVQVLPVLHNLVPEFESGRGFGREQQLLLPKWSSHNSENIGSLFQTMLKFYCDFDFQKYCISVRDGAAVDVEQAIARDPDVSLTITRSSRQTWGAVNIQEPFNFTNTARAASKKISFEKIKEALVLSNQLLCRKGGIEILLGRSKSDLGQKGR